MNIYDSFFRKKVSWRLMQRWLTAFLALSLCYGTAMAQLYRVGDLYTAPDSSQGIVYYQHPDGSGGWVVALNDASTGCGWGTAVDIPDLGNQNITNDYRQQLLNDTAGYAHTQVIRTYQGNSGTTAAGVVDFGHGWYLPAPAQLSILYGQLPIIESALTAAGGTSLTTNYYWCSAERDTSNAWAVSFSSGNFYSSSKTSSRRVRAVRSFTYPAAGDVTYTWNDGSIGSSITVSPSAATTYSVTATNSASCEAVASKEVTPVGCSAVIDSKSCPAAPTVTDHEGNVYATVQIGSQCWMRDNLRTTTSPSTGTYLIPAAGTGYTCTGKQARWYNDDSTTYAPMNYGLLYNWNAAVDTFNTSYGETSVNSASGNAVSVSFTGHRRGICPVGWHLPSDAAWTQLENYVGSQSEYTCGDNSSYIAKALADSTDWNTSTNTCSVGNDQSDNNTTSFSAFPAGIYLGSYSNFGSSASFWSSTEYDSHSDFAWIRYLSYNYADVLRSSFRKNNGFSVRCVRD